MGHVVDRWARLIEQRGQSGMVGTALVSMVVMVMVTVPVAFQLQATNEAPIGAQSVYGQAALSAAQAGIQDYIDHLESQGTTYVSSYCSSNYFTQPSGGCGADTTNPAFLNDPTSTNNDRTNPSGIPTSKWVTEPSASGVTGKSYGAVEAYNYLVDTSSFSPTTVGTYPIRVYSTGRAGVGSRYVYRRVKATITLSVSNSTAEVSQPVTWQSPTPPSTSCTTPSNTTVNVPPWANYAEISLAGGAGGTGGTSLDLNVPAGGAGAGFTASMPVTPGTWVTLISGCAGSTNGLVSSGAGGGSGGSGSACNPVLCFLLGGTLGGPGGGGGGASAIVQCATSSGCTPATASQVLAVAGGGGGGGGDALVNLGLGVLGGATGGAGGAATPSQCTNANGCSAPTSIDSSTAGSGVSVTGGGGGGGGGSTSTVGSVGQGYWNRTCWLLDGSGCDGGSGGSMSSGTGGGVGSQSSQCTNHAPSGCTDGSAGGGGGGGESGYLVGGIASGAGGGGGGGYTGGGGGGGGGALITTGTGGGGGGAGASYLVSTGTVEPYSIWANAGNGMAYVTFFSKPILFASTTVSSSGTWTPTVSCLGPLTVTASGGGGSTGGNTGGNAGGGAIVTVTVPAPSSTVTDCTTSSTNYVNLVATVAGASSGSGSGGTVGGGYSSGGTGIAGACNAPQCAGGEGGGSTALCQSSPCTSSNNAAGVLVVAGGGGGGGGKSNGNSPGGAGGNGSVTGSAGGAGNGSNPGAGGAGGGSSTATGQGGLGTPGNGAGGGGGGGAGYSNGGGGGTAGGSTLLNGSGGGGGGGGGNSYPSYASVSDSTNVGAGAITIYYAYTTTINTPQLSLDSEVSSQVVPSTATP